MAVKSVISAPLQGAVIEPGSIVIAGYAWSGHGAVEEVEVSVDGGVSWRLADLDRAGRHSWVRFHYPWTATRGRHRLMARATDERRLRQPAVTNWNGKGYGQNGIHCVEVIVDEDTLFQTWQWDERGLTIVHKFSRLCASQKRVRRRRPKLNTTRATTPSLEARSARFGRQTLLPTPSPETPARNAGVSHCLGTRTRDEIPRRCSLR